jgi:hypothetical protein
MCISKIPYFVTGGGVKWVFEVVSEGAVCFSPSRWMEGRCHQDACDNGLSLAWDRERHRTYAATLLGCLIRIRKSQHAFGRNRPQGRLSSFSARESVPRFWPSRALIRDSLPRILAAVVNVPRPQDAAVGPDDGVLRPRDSSPRAVRSKSSVAPGFKVARVVRQFLADSACHARCAQRLSASGVVGWNLSLPRRRDSERPSGLAAARCPLAVPEPPA